MKAEGDDRDALYTRLAEVRVGNASALAARGGVDHIFLNPRDGGEFENAMFTQLDMNDLRLGGATRLAMGEAHNQPSPRGVQPSSSIYHSVPFASVVHIDPAARGGLPWAHDRSRARDKPLIAATWNDRKSDVGVLRRVLKQQCLARPESCTFMAPEADPKHAKPGDQLMREIAALYWGATFCLSPPGDFVSRKGVVDARCSAASPSSLRRGSASCGGGRGASWAANATVLLPFDHFLRGNINVVNYLTTIPQSRIEAMRDTLAAHAHRLHYATIDTAHLAGILPEPLDAFDVAIAGAHRLSLAPGAVRHGLRLQQEAEEVAARQAVPTTRGGPPSSRRAPAPSPKTTPAAPKARPRGRGRCTTSATSSCSTSALARPCLKCARCNFISVSRPYSDCSWFEECDLTNPGGCAPPPQHEGRPDRRRTLVG